MKKSACIIISIAVLTGFLHSFPAKAQKPSVDFSHGKLKVSENKRFLVHEDGTPFFWLGDTAWEMFQQLNREDADIYLANRAAKGFTVVQAVLIAVHNGLTDPNPYGALPLIDKNPAKPNEAYFKHVDYIVKKANQYGIVIGMVPTWWSAWKTGSEDAVLTPENAYLYGKFLGERYRDAQLVWILGGDANVENDNERKIITMLARGLREGDNNQHLITFHPRGPGQSSLKIHKEEWLDFNMIQSSHAARNHDTGLFVERDYALSPVKPTLDGEPRYENLAVGFYLNNVDTFDRFDDFDVRQAAYWSLLAGACGFTYGNNNVWQMWTPERESNLWANVPWKKALDHPGAFQMSHVRALFESRPFTLLRPDTSFVVDGPLTGGAKIRASVATDGSFAIVYSPMGMPFTVDDSRINSINIKQIWYNPRYGTSFHIHTTDTSAFQTFTPPSSGRGNDWILILEDADAGFPMPGFN